MTDTEPFYLTVCEVAKLLRVSPQTVRRWASRGQIVCVRRRVTPAGPARYLIPREAALAKLERVVAEPARPAAVAPMDPRTLELARRFGLL
jgi:excisionase family DNA binding protein